MSRKILETDYLFDNDRSTTRHGDRSLLSRIALWVCIAVTSTGVARSVASCHAADSEQQAVQRLLARLGLVDLQIFDLEQQLKSAGASDRDLDAARQLADLYATRLMNSAEDKTRFDEVMARIQDLLKRFPQANTTALQVMLLQADYNQAETRIAEWIADPQEPDAKQNAVQTLTRIAPLLEEYQKRLNTQLTKLTDQADNMTEGDALRTLEQKTRRIQIIAARATYFSAWTNYYLALLQGDALNSALYQRARTTFRMLLGIGDQKMSAVEIEWLGLGSVWKARALIGLGLAEAACEHAEASETCFGLLENTVVPTQIRDQAAYWHLRALLGTGRVQQAIEFAQRMVTGFTADATQGEVSFCVALVRAGFGPPADKRSAIPDKTRAEIGKLGLVGLAKLGQLGAVDKLLEKNAIPVDDSAGFILLWARGQRLFGEAEKSKQSSDYKEAARSLQAALESRDAGILPGPAARCRYSLAWCDYRQGDFEEAARQFALAADALREVKNPLAPEAAWMVFVAYRQLSKNKPSFLSKATAALDRLKTDFPKHSYAKRADLELARLLASTSPDETVRFLKAVKPNDPNYLTAQYELCVLWHKRWSLAKGKTSEARACCQELNQAVDTYLQAARGEKNTQRSAKVCLLLVDAASQAPVSDETLAARYLAQAEPFTRTLDIKDPLVAEYHYRALRQATRRGDAEGRRRHAQWLVDYAAGSPYEQAALVVIAGALDKAAASTSASPDSPATKEAYSTFKRLVTSLGDSPDKLAANKNSRVAVSRLAYYAEQMGRSQEAADLLAKLLVPFPRDRGYLQRAAMAAFRSGQFDRALTHWRTLLAGLPRGSEAWLEAKYYQLKCLAETDKERAQRVFRQFQLLYPDLGGRQWRAKFQQLTPLE